MKRSTKDKFYVTPHDFALAMVGVKTASSRNSDRSELWPVGHRLRMVDNTDESRFADIEITYHAQTSLTKISSTQTFNIGGYGIFEHQRDYLSVYSDAHFNHDVYIVGFRILG